MIELSDTFKVLEKYDLALVILGVGILGMAALLHRFERLPFSFPILALLFGYLAFALPLGLTPPDPEIHGSLIVHVTEIGVIVSLMGVGLKIDRWPNPHTWSNTWRMLGICMPLTIIGVALLGWWMVGLAPAAAVLLGAALAPTDPVLASDVQVGEPDVEVGEHNSSQDAVEPAEKEDELRFTLTSEAGLNDSLAFPFTYLALLMLAEGVSPTNWIVEWLLTDVLYRIAVGAIAGVTIGWLLTQVLLRLSVDTEAEKMRTGVGALAATLLLYGITECAGGYGFLAVFVGALTIRHNERTRQAHLSLHMFSEQAEHLLMTVILIALGGAIAGGLLSSLSWEAIILSALLVFAIRPVAGWIALLGNHRLPHLDRLSASFFGIRGIGCLYYLAYALNEGVFPDESLLWSVCAFVVMLSVIVHGVTAAPLMWLRDQRLDRGRGEGASA